MLPLLKIMADNKKTYKPRNITYNNMQTNVRSVKCPITFTVLIIITYGCVMTIGSSIKLLYTPWSNNMNSIEIGS
jgi:hypothetical protein